MEVEVEHRGLPPQLEFQVPRVVVQEVDVLLLEEREILLQHLCLKEMMEDPVVVLLELVAEELVL
tara:strand:+ start:387 stop:581 length:195 start_codon:yes stop_codon:yes gene_type:complete